MCTAQSHSFGLLVTCINPRDYVLLHQDVVCMRVCPECDVCLKIASSPFILAISVRHSPSDRRLTLKTMGDGRDYCWRSGPALPQSPLPFWGLRRGGLRSLLHSTGPRAVRRSTGTCARSPAGFLRDSEPAPAASPGWRGPCRLGRGLGRGGGGG